MEAVVAYLRYYFCIFVEGLMKRVEDQPRRACLPAESGNVRNMQQVPRDL
jgi:hypothetical protein